MVFSLFSSTSILSKIFNLNKMSPPPSFLQQILSGLVKPEVVKIRDTSNTEQLISTIIQRGAKSLQVITDFDATLTRYHQDGKKCDSSYGIIANTPLVTEDYRNKSLELYKKYYPIEIACNMTIEEKIPHMVEWYVKSHEHMVSSKPRLNKLEIKEMVRLSFTHLRDNTKKMLETLYNVQVPVLVLSAGIGNIVEEVLLHNSVDFSNIKVISNFMEFDNNNFIIGFKEPLIHMYNKNEAALHNMHSQYFEELKSRDTVILLGDSLGDVNMDHGVSSPQAVLKIGFLNSNVNEQLESYLSAFDIVLVDDQSMDFVNLLLSHLKRKESPN